MFLLPFYFKILYYFLLCISVSQIDGRHTLIAKTNVLFHEVINKNMFFSGSKNVKFTVSINEMADMPQWLKLEQKESISDAILYGTPPVPGMIMLEIIALNKDTYETSRDEWMLSIQRSDLNLTYQVEFKIKNTNLVEMLPLNNIFIKAVQRHWPNAKFISSIHKLSSHTGNKKGVIVIINGDTAPTTQFSLIKSNCHSLPRYIQQMFYNDGFQVDWCALKMITNDNSHQSYLSDFYPVLFNTHIYSNLPASLSVDIAYVVVPFLFGILCVVLLTFAICSKSKYRTPTETWFDQKDFQKYNNIADKNITGFVYGELDEENTDSRSSTPFQMNQYNSLPKYSHIKVNGNIDSAL